MHILVISDIHANLTALQAVLSDAGEIDGAWCLGDLVGYGPDPNECIALVRQLPNLKCILGNHDAAVLNQINTEAFNPEARQAILWTKNALSEENFEFLKNLPDKIELEQVTLVHGSPRQPVWEYLLDTYTALRNLDHFSTPYCFVGHTHLPCIFRQSEQDTPVKLSVPVPNEKEVMVPRAIFNGGSVGQPRDRDARAAYAIFDTDEQIWDYRRVAYDIPNVQQRMENAELPIKHIQRLASGW